MSHKTKISFFCDTSPNPSADLGLLAPRDSLHVTKIPIWVCSRAVLEDCGRMPDDTVLNTATRSEARAGGAAREGLIPRSRYAKSCDAF